VQGPIVQFERFGFQYHAQAEPTLFDIDLTIRRGEKVLICGPSGSGKSTLGHCINGLIPERFRGECTGKLYLDGVDASTMGLYERSKLIGTVLQDTDGQFVGLTVGEDVAFALENRRVPQDEMKREVARAAGSVGIATHLDHKPHALSGGQKQRASMAGVLVDNVDILLFDEPLANLDPATGRQAIALIDDIQRETGVTVIIIEHRLEDALHRAVDRIVLIGDGRIVADLPPNDMLISAHLRDWGIREPLYLTALRYAGASLAVEIRPEHIDSLRLDLGDGRGRLLKWYQETPPPPPPEPRKPLLSVAGISFAYSRESPDVLKNISFDVGEGEMVAIAGRNGAGKSTMAKLICGFVKPREGVISLDGGDLAGVSITDRARRIGYVMQNPNQMICKPMIYDEVALGLRNAGTDADTTDKSVRRALKVCGLRPFRKWPVSALSFGQKKRVTIASILALEPSIIILDEPTAGQDFRHYTEIMTFLQDLNARGLTIIMITHDMHLMLEYAPRVLVIVDGELIADDSPARVLSDEALCERASLKETSLYTLAGRLGLPEPSDFVQRFIDHDRTERSKAYAQGGADVSRNAGGSRNSNVSNDTDDSGVA
jgi:energy-coupling factor transport system ATP-binding protein